MTEQTKKQTKILIIGGGFGGIKAALEISRNEEFSVTLVSDKDDFRYNPTLYHTVTGGLMKQSSIPIGNILKGGNITFINKAAVKLNRENQTIEFDDGTTVAYDKLVLALGVVANYFGIKGLKEYSYSIKTLEEVKELKLHLHNQLESEDKIDLNYLIVGAGPTGIELAGALPSYIRKIMKAHGVSDRKANVKLIEAAPRLLPRSSKKVSSAVEKRLKNLGVELYIGKSVDGASADSLMVENKPVQTKTIVWTAGTANSPFFQDNKFELSKRGKVVVDEHLMAEPNIYVIGDNAETIYSGLAQIALYDGAYVARDIEAKHFGNLGSVYKPSAPATVIPVGTGWAAFEWGKFAFAGRLGWVLRQAADWIGFHEIQPWWDANSQWLTEFGEEETCLFCDKSKNKLNSTIAP